MVGENVGRGYINNGELTAKSFINNWHKLEERGYKTGDLGRKLHDGTIEFLGRKDRQLKIRGYRVDLKAIEKTLLDDKTIQEAVVVPYSTNSLVAFIVLRQEASIQITTIKEDIKATLPSYMIPENIVVLKKFPRLGTVSCTHLTLQTKA